MTMSTHPLLIELGTEELPPKSLQSLGLAFQENIVNELKQCGLETSKARLFITARRLALLLEAVPTRQSDRMEQKRGPKVAAAFSADGEPTKAALGFARSCGVSIEALGRFKKDNEEWLLYQTQKKGEVLHDVLGPCLQRVLKQLPIAKQMRWGGKLTQFVRPVHWLLVLHGESVVPVTVLGLDANRYTWGHRVHARENSPLALAHAQEYERVLKDKGKVIPCFDERKQSIRAQVALLAQKAKGTPVYSETLLDEITALVEWPVALIGRFDEAFLELPKEVLVSTMQDHQKYIALRNERGQLLSSFIMVANLDSKNSKAVIMGNERVIRPRFSDAQFFYQQDQKQSLESYNRFLEKIVFQKRLGTLYEKVQRVASLAKWIALHIQTEADLAYRAGLLCKADLATDMVGEFPELQGIMGAYYAHACGEDPVVTLAIKEHYWPDAGQAEIPTHPVSVSVALADKLDTLVGIFGIGAKPSGEKDPFALRRAALGLIKICTEGKYNVDLGEFVQKSYALYPQEMREKQLLQDTPVQVLTFIENRYLPWYYEQKIPKEMVYAVLQVQSQNPLDLALRVKAVNAFSRLEAAQALSEVHKRVRNLLKKEGLLEKRPSGLENIDRQLLRELEEQNLLEAMEKLVVQVEHHVHEQRYEQALMILSELHRPVADFFDKVMILTDDSALKDNRIALLKQLYWLFLKVADISQLY